MIHRIKQDLTVGTDAYTALDNVGGLITFPVSAASADGYAHGIIRGIVITDEAGQAEKYQMYFFNADPSATCDTDDATFNPSATDVDKMLWVEYIADTDYLTVTGVQSMACVTPDAPVVFDGKNLYAVLVAVETPDYAAATDVNVTLYLEV